MHMYIHLCAIVWIYEQYTRTWLSGTIKRASMPTAESKHFTLLYPASMTTAIYVCVWVYIYILICINIYNNTSVYMCVCVCEYTYLCVCVCQWMVHVRIHMCICIQEWTRLTFCSSLHRWPLPYKCVCEYTHIYIYTHVYACVWENVFIRLCVCKWYVYIFMCLCKYPDQRIWLSCVNDYCPRQWLLPCTCVWECTYICVCEYVYLHVCVCIWIMYVHIHMCMHIYRINAFDFVVAHGYVWV